ncbi:MAG: hypothetical protein NTY61_01705 [Candidatus Parcubacteria bacterium]|nr:hypothetical protein [Candidatus Parcubacteria bacterium]
MGQKEEIMGSLKDVERVEDLSTAHFFALVNKCGGLEDALAVLRGEKKITLEDVIRLLLDRNGRCIPDPEVVTANVCDANADYYFDRLTADVDYAAILLAWEALFGQKSGMDAEQFKARIEAIKQRVMTWPTADKPQIANLFVGPHFPIILPQLPAGDHGTILEQHILPVVEQAYLTAFPDQKFVNYRKNDLAGKTTIVDERHAQLIADLQKGPVPGIVCYPLQGFSIHAQRQMATLMPEFISLAGAIEPGVTTAMNPKLVARDVHTPVQDCSALQWQDSDSSLFFDAYGVRLGFGFRGYLGDAFDAYSGGFFVRG